jgi:hypothetical protein
MLLGRISNCLQFRRCNSLSSHKHSIEEGISLIAVPSKYSSLIFLETFGNSVILEQPERSSFSRHPNLETALGRFFS